MIRHMSFLYKMQGALFILCFSCIAFSSAYAASSKTLPHKTLSDFKIVDINGKEVSLSQYKNKVVLIVNTASKCGFTKQYSGLEAIYKEFENKGFTVLGFPSNDFKNQEPGTDSEILKFCNLNYGVTFPLFKKTSVSGETKSPLFKWLTDESGAEFSGEVQWNFEKFLIGKDGKLKARFGSFTTPDSERVKQAIEELLNASK